MLMRMGLGLAPVTLGSADAHIAHNQARLAGRAPHPHRHWQTGQWNTTPHSDEQTNKLRYMHMYMCCSPRDVEGGQRFEKSEQTCPRAMRGVRE